MRAGNDLGSGRIGVLVGRIALPSMLAQFVSVLYSIVDRMYIGHIPGDGRTGAGRRRRMRPGGDDDRLRGVSGGRGRRAADEHQHGRGRRRTGRAGILANCFVMLCVFAAGR